MLMSLYAVLWVKLGPLATLGKLFKLLKLEPGSGPELTILLPPPLAEINRRTPPHLQPSSFFRSRK